MPNPNQCLVIVHIGSRRVSATVAWREKDEERVVAHRGVECRWHELGDRGRKQVVSEVLALACESAGIQVYSVFISISNPTLRANFATGYVDLGDELVFTAEDRSLALSRAAHQAIGQDREVLHALPQRWALRSSQGERDVEDPVGQRGSRLTCHVLLVTADRATRAEAEILLEGCEVAIEGMIAPPVALYRALASLLPKKGSSLIVDIGARHTSLLVHRKERLVHVETHAFGSDHLTEAIATELGLPFDQAESLKHDLDLGAHLKNTDAEGQIYLWREVQERQRQLAPAARITCDRLREFFNARARDLRELELVAVNGRIHLVGRGSSLGGLTALVRECFGLPTFLGTNQDDRELSSELRDLITVGLIRQAALERERRLRDRTGSSIRQVAATATGFWAWLMQPIG